MEVYNTVIDPKKKQELIDLVQTISAIKGRHTELVTVYIPGGANINLTSNQLDSERSTAENIKSKQVRSNVIDALNMIVRELKKYKQTPENGLAIFCGNISDKEGEQDLKLWMYEPPRLLNIKLYRCDQEFIIDPLKEMTSVDAVYGLLVIDRQAAMIGLLEGNNIKVLQKLTSGVPGKIKAGGQSSQRFHRITEGLAKEFYRKVAEKMKDQFFDMPKLKGILIGGPIPTKEDFIDEGNLVTKLKEKIIAIKDLGYVDEHGLELLVEDSRDDLVEQELTIEKNHVKKFFETLGKDKKMAVYGKDVLIALERGAVDTLYISKKLEKSAVEELEKRANNIGSKIFYISVEHTDGEQFFNLTKGVGAILRFALE